MNSSRLPNFEWARLTLTIPRIAEVIYKVVEITNYILDTFSIEYTQQAFTHAYGTFHNIFQCMMIKWGSSMHKTKHGSYPGQNVRHFADDIFGCIFVVDEKFVP